ncbi:MAG: MBL fold metallo-hydrolase [Chloroflexota bacterium]
MQVYENLVHIRHMLMMNCYLVREEDGFTLVDTLMRGAADKIAAAAESLDMPIKRIVLTHAHIDHVGSLDALHARLPDAEVIAHAREVPLLKKDKSLQPDEPQTPIKGGVPGVATNPTQIVAEGDMIGSLRVIFAPGHTPGHMALVDTRDNTLIAGDAFSTMMGTVVSGKMNWLFPLPAFATWHKPTALETAKKLRALDPSKLAVGHGQVLINPLPDMDKAIREAEKAFA